MIRAPIHLFSVFFSFCPSGLKALRIESVVISKASILSSLGLAQDSDQILRLIRLFTFLTGESELVFLVLHLDGLE